MPGIFGVIDAAPVSSQRHQQELLAIAKQMSAAMLYEPGYSELVVSCPAVGACVGRVGFLDATDSERGEDEASVVALTTGDAVSGSPDRHIASTGARLGPGAREVIRAYRRAGVDGLADVSGIYAAFVADQARARCLLFNDRYGRERLFLHASGTRVFFSSEAKAILAVAPATRGFDPTGLAELLACGCTLGSQSLFRGIEVLESGTVLTFDGPSMRRRRYFDRAQLEQLDPVSGRDFLDGFSASLRSAVNESVRTAPQVGISLTGGLDSRMIMASLDAPAGTVPCYTFGSMYRTTGDVAVGRQVAARCGQPHRVLELGKGFLATVRETLEQSVYVSDGYLGLSGAAELYVNRQARAMAPARMTGNWGGELMRGVRAFKYVMPKGGFISAELAKQMSESAAAFSTTSANPLSATLFHQMPFQGYGRYAIERSQTVMRSPFLADDVVKWLYRAPVDVRESSAGAAAVIGRRPDLLAIPTDLGLLGTGPSFMRRASRRALIKAEYWTSHGAPDWLARISARLPGSLVESRFLGVDKFQHFRFWMRRDLAGFVRDTLTQNGADGDLGSLFDMPRVRQMVNEHIDGRANYTDEIDKLLTVALVQKTLFGQFRQVQG
jgi:asparagine synthase (glutamine-hydrolysing)